MSTLRRPRHVELEPACGSRLGELVPLQALSPITASCPRRPRTRSSGGTTEAKGIEKRKLSQQRRTLVSDALLEPYLSPATTPLLPTAHYFLLEECGSQTPGSPGFGGGGEDILLPPPNLNAGHD